MGFSSGTALSVILYFLNSAHAFQGLGSLLQTKSLTPQLTPLGKHDSSLSGFISNFRLSAGNSDIATTEAVITEKIRTSEGITSSEPTLAWKPEGYSFWEFEGHKIHYVASGDSSLPPLVLIHGFGASHFHWRYNIPELSQKYRVYAVDLLGFGLSDKPILDYTGELWRDQIAAFIREVVGVGMSEEGEGGVERAVVAGNSLGGYTALATSAVYPSLVKGCILLNAAGRFDPPEDVLKAQEEQAATQEAGQAWPPQWYKDAVAALGQALQRGVIQASFYYTKQPLRIKQVLSQVYTDTKNVDDDLVESIRFPAENPNAPEVFYRVIRRNGGGPQTSVNTLLQQLSVPLLLLWGEQDPWIRPAAAQKIMEIYPSAEMVPLVAGHCPHDEVPQEVNQAILEWSAKI